ncbi:MAG: hypothetical protein IKJ35_02950 [Clostridia bacterium]|nr:hypothetical protein [Clostridia bacterium]
MKTYLLTLITTAFAVTLAGMLSPRGEGGGIAKHLKLLGALLLVCVLISPLSGIIEGLRAFANGEIDLSWTEDKDSEDYREDLQGTLDGASRQYVCEMLTQTLEQRFSVSRGEIRCAIQWSEKENTPRPSHVSVILSGQAIWKSPKEIETFVTELLGCGCSVAIE